MVKKLRICLIGSAQSIHIKRWARFLASEGHDVHVLSVFHDVIEGVKVWTLPAKEHYGNIAYLLSIPRVYWLLKRLNPDIVHFHYLGGTSLYFPIIYRYVVVSTPWGSDIYALKNKFKKMAVAQILKNSRRITTTSKNMADTIVKIFNIDRTRIVPCSWGIDINLFKPASAEERMALRKELDIPLSAFVVFSNRTMAPVYNTDLTVAVFLAAKEIYDELFLILVEGPTPNSSIFEYRSRIANIIGNKDYIRVLWGIVSPEVMSSYLRISNVVISIPTSDQRSSSTLEALACSPAVILSNLPAYQEMIREGYGAIILPHVKRESLLQAILTVRHEKLYLNRTTLAANYALIQKQEDWIKQADKVVAEYYTIIAHQD